MNKHGTELSPSRLAVDLLSFTYPPLKIRLEGGTEIPL